MNPAAVELGDVQRSLSLFAQGLLGRPLHLRTVDATARDGRLRSILTDGQHLHLPVRIDDFPTARENLGAYRVAILQQIGYLQSGTFDFDPPPPCTPSNFPPSNDRRSTVPPSNDARHGAGHADAPAGSPLAALSLWRLPGIRARRPIAPLERFFAEAPQPALLRRVFGIVEAMRVTANVRRAYPGARADIARVHAHALAARPDPSMMRPHIALIEALVQASLDARFAPREPGDPLTAMLAMAEPVTRADADARDSARISQAICALLATVTTLRPIRRSDRASSDPGSTPFPAPATDGRDPFARRGADAMAADGASDDGDDGDRPEQSDGAPSGQGGDALPPPVVQVDPNDLDGIGPAVAFHGVLAADLVEQSRAETRARRALPGMDVDVEAATASDGQAPGGKDDAADDENDGADGDRRQDRPPAARAPTARRRLDDDSQRSFLYDEWDYLGQRYRKAWCRVLEERLRGDPSGGDMDFIADVRRRHAHLSARVRRQFAAIKPDAFRRVHHTPDGDEFELSSLIDAVIDRRTGHVGDEQIYVRRERAQREVAAAFLVDMSASTDYPIPEPPPVASDAQADPNAGSTAKARAGKDDGDDEFPYLYGGYPGWEELAPPVPRRRVIDVQKDALALMCDALHALGDSYAAYGFSGEGRHRVEFKLIKDFGDRLGARAWAAMAAMKPRRSTRMGPAIRHAASKLLREPARRKVLIIVSDGYPEDDDYGPERGDPEYGIQDTARALREAESAGVTTFCVTVDPAGHDYLRRMCPNDRYLVITDVDALPAELTKVYRALTA